MIRHRVAAVCLTLALVAPAAADDVAQGRPDLKSAGPLAFAPRGTLFIGDPKGAAIYAVRLDDTQGNPEGVELNVEGVDEKIAAALGTTKDDILINDLAVNPETGGAYLSVSRGRGPEGTPVILRVDGEGEITEVPLDDVSFVKFELPNAPEDKVTGEGRRRQNNRLESITDLAFIDGKLYVAGLSNEEFASKLRVIPIPPDQGEAGVSQGDPGASVEIYHGSHGGFETHSPVRTFTVVDIEDAPHLLAAYTCTPLVKIPVAMLKPGEKVRGETIAELGNRNRPLDMIVYEKDGEEFVLLANSARGLMKMPLAKAADLPGITERIEDTAGLEYETIDGVEGVVQLDRLNDGHALALVQVESGPASLKTMPLP
jgi:hypothetical protein